MATTLSRLMICARKFRNSTKRMNLVTIAILETSGSASTTHILFGSSLIRRSVTTVPGQFYYVPEGDDSSNSVKDMIEHLDAKRPTYTLLYFTASWNPMCAKIEKDYEELVKTNSSFHHIRVDTDATPKLKFYFDARVEP